MLNWSYCLLFVDASLFAYPGQYLSGFSPSLSKWVLVLQQRSWGLRSQHPMVSAPGRRWQNWTWLLWFFVFTCLHWWSLNSLKLLLKITLVFDQKNFIVSLLFYWISCAAYCIMPFQKAYNNSGASLSHSEVIYSKKDTTLISILFLLSKLIKIFYLLPIHLVNLKNQC